MVPCRASVASGVHRDAAVTSLILPCQSNAPFAKLVRLSKTSVADKMRAVHTRHRVVKRS
jgi:hypothetical protein